MRCNWLIAGLLVAVISAPWTSPGTVEAAGETYALGHELIGHAEQVLKQAAMKSPNWHSRQDSIQRDVYDITFLLEQALRAAEKSNDAARKDYAAHALTLLQRAVTRGHFDPAQVEPVLVLIRRLLPDVPV